VVVVVVVVFYSLQYVTQERNCTSAIILRLLNYDYYHFILFYWVAM